MSRIVIEKTTAEESKSKLILDFELDTSRSYTIGRHPSNDVQIDHASISRMHALIFHHGSQWMIADLDSTKGLVHNNTPIRCGPLKDEMCVLMGPARMWFAEGPDKTSEKPETITKHLDVLQIEIRSPEGQSLSTQAYCLAGFRSVSIGSDAECDIRPKNSEVKPLHAIAFRRNDQWFVTSSDETGLESDDQRISTFLELGDKRSGSCGCLAFSLIRAIPIS
jgi:pSer/pThr/pTyr-binding forkhead associated (FHA) protein